MSDAGSLFDRMFAVDSSVPAAQRAVLRSSFIETYHQSPLMRERMAALEARLASLPPEHQKIAIRSTSGETQFNFFDSAAFLAGKPMQTLEINFDQLKHTLGCNLQTGQRAQVFSPALTIWGHEVAGHAADPNIHKVQDAMLGRTDIAAQFGTGASPEKVSALETQRLRVTQANLGTANRGVSIVEHSILEREAVRVTDQVGREVAAQTGQPFTPRGYYFNGIMKNYDDFMKQFEGMSPEKQAKIMSDLATQRGLTVSADISPRELFDQIQQHDCQVMPRVIQQELRER